jgi:hypothetical protein
MVRAARIRRVSARRGPTNISGPTPCVVAELRQGEHVQRANAPVIDGRACTRWPARAGERVQWANGARLREATNMSGGPMPNARSMAGLVAGEHVQRPDARVRWPSCASCPAIAERSAVAVLRGPATCSAARRPRRCARWPGWRPANMSLALDRPASGGRPQGRATPTRRCARRRTCPAARKAKLRRRAAARDDEHVRRPAPRRVVAARRRTCPAPDARAWRLEARRADRAGGPARWPSARGGEHVRRRPRGPTRD